MSEHIESLCVSIVHAIMAAVCVILFLHAGPALPRSPRQQRQLELCAEEARSQGKAQGLVCACVCMCVFEVHLWWRSFGARYRNGFCFLIYVGDDYHCLRRCCVFLQACSIFVSETLLSHSSQMA